MDAFTAALPRSQPPLAGAPSMILSCLPGQAAQLQPRTLQEQSTAPPRQCRYPAEALLSASCPSPAQEIPAAGLAISRRTALPALALPLLLGAAASSQPAWAGDVQGEADIAASPSIPDSATYTSQAQGYSFSYPATWEQVNKAGADVLFQDHKRKSTTLGVTVYPVTISSLEEFGDLAAVGRRLLDAERAKESTIRVEMLSQQQRNNDGSSGPMVYDFVYKLDSTRGAKQIWSTVTVAKRKLYILNGNLSCGKGAEAEAGPCSSGGAAAEALQRAAQSFRVR